MINLNQSKYTVDDPGPARPDQQVGTAYYVLQEQCMCRGDWTHDLVHQHSYNTEWVFKRLELNYHIYAIINMIKKLIMFDAICSRQAVNKL